jgi:hypothetical protein
MVRIRTDLTFDPLGAAESAAGMTMSAILHPARAQRLVSHHARENTQPSLEEVLNTIVNGTIKKASPAGLQGETKRVVDDVVVNYMIRLALDSDAGSQVRALTMLTLEDLNTWLKGRSPNTADKAHYAMLNRKINEFFEDPADFKVHPALNPPDGSPIGAIFGMECEH